MTCHSGGAIFGGMPTLPSLDLSRVRIPLQADTEPRGIQEFTIAELKDELLRRGNVDFSKWEVIIKLSPFFLLFGAVTVYKLSQALNGTYLGCLLQ